jgi:hypothetical protein
MRDGRVEVISGLKDGDRVVERGAGFLKDGDRINIVRPEQAVESPDAAPAGSKRT